MGHRLGRRRRARQGLPAAAWRGARRGAMGLPAVAGHGPAGASAASTKLESLVDKPAVGQFVIGQAKVIPNVSGIYHRGSPIGVYLQVYNAGIDQTTLRPSVDVEYALTKDGKEIGKQAEDWRGLSDSGQRLTLARLIDSRQLAPGEYELTIRIRDHVSGQSLAPSAKFTVVPQ